MDDEQPYHDHGGPSGALRIVEVVDIFGENNGDDYVRYTHTDGTDSENGLAANTVDVEYSGDGESQLDSG